MERGFWSSLLSPQLMPCTLSTPTSFAPPVSVQERKLQDLEVELETRTKDVKAKLAHLGLQVREQEPQTLEL